MADSQSMTREIVINGRFLSRRVTGVERHGREILSLFGNRVRVVPTRVHGAAGHAWEQFSLPLKLNPNSLLWSPANTGPLIIQNQMLTIHDLSPLEHPEWFKSGFAIWYRLFLPLLARRVQKIFTPSEFIRQKVMRRFGVTQVIVTPNGVDRSIFHPGAKQTDQILPNRYVLFAGSIEPRKNLGTLIHAWTQIKNDFRDTWLVIAGSEGTVFRNVEMPRQAERVRFLGYVDDTSLPGLYANAELFVLPSMDEGFGLPALEAMASGTPVIVSNGGALPELVREAGLIFDLSAPDTLASAMTVCLGNQNSSRVFVEKGLARAKEFSWQNTADLIWKTFHEN